MFISPIQDGNARPIGNNVAPVLRMGPARAQAFAHGNPPLELGVSRRSDSDAERIRVIAGPGDDKVVVFKPQDSIEKAFRAGERRRDEGILSTPLPQAQQAFKPNTTSQDMYYF